MVCGKSLWWGQVVSCGVLGWWGDGAAGDVGEGGYAEVGGAAGGEGVELGEFVLGGGQADGEAVDFAEPAVLVGFVDAGA
jgi:hypothetical protein